MVLPNLERKQKVRGSFLYHRHDGYNEDNISPHRRYYEGSPAHPPQQGDNALRLLQSFRDDATNKGLGQHNDDETKKSNSHEAALS